MQSNPAIPEPTLRYVAFTHPGKSHPHNQDAILVAGQVLQKAAFVDGLVPLADMPRFAISDGVSGNPQPAAASRLLLQALLALEATHPGSLHRQGPSCCMIGCCGHSTANAAWKMPPLR